MNAQMRWFDEFVRWFFNASPLWVDERKVLRAPFEPRRTIERRATPRDRRPPNAHVSSFVHSGRKVTS